jgi:hypothetical protein
MITDQQSLMIEKMGELAGYPERFGVYFASSPQRQVYVDRLGAIIDDLRAGIHVEARLNELWRLGHEALEEIDPFGDPMVGCWGLRDQINRWLSEIVLWTDELARVRHPAESPLIRPAATMKRILRLRSLSESEL